MKKLFMPVLALLIANSCLAQNAKIEIGSIDSMKSNILHEQRKIWVHVPDSWKIGSKQRYPVLYLLDGDAHFYSVVGMIQQLSEVNGNTLCPEMIVVGIPNTDRSRDLTPTHADADVNPADSVFFKTSGGGESFTAFIEKELMPYIDYLYPTDAYKILVGHSLGGLTVVNMATHHTRLFNAYIAIDPSLWWDKMHYLAATKKTVSAKSFGGIALYIGIANTMEDGMDPEKVKNDTGVDTRHIRSILDFDNYIKSINPNGIRYESKYYPNDDHGSVPLIAEYDGLRFIFEKFRFKLSYKEYTDSTFDLAKKYENHYVEVSRLFGYKVLPPEGTINALGYQCLQQKQYIKAAALFKMNMTNYPVSFNVYDSYGDYLLATGDKQNAIVYFKKALSLSENRESRNKLNELLK